MWLVRREGADRLAVDTTLKMAVCFPLMGDGEVGRGNAGGKVMGERRVLPSYGVMGMCLSVEPSWSRYKRTCTEISRIQVVD